MNPSLTLLLKLLGSSALFSLAIKYLGPKFPIPLTNPIALTIVLSVPLLTALILALQPGPKTP
jgi:hypothetical protein